MSIYDFTVKDIKGADYPMSQHRGQVMLIVNTASKCGFTEQYDGLEALYEKYKDRGFVVIGFPCDQFAHQEPGSNEEIASFCRLKFGVSFPMMSKIDVNGDGTAPIFKFLKEEAPGLLGSTMVKWNFTKFLVDRQGKVVDRFASATKPEELHTPIEKLLG